jgi:two-component sensor histidine kinase
MARDPPDRTEDGLTIERRYRALFENMFEGFVVCEAMLDGEGRLVDYWVRTANPVFLARAPDGPQMIDRRQREIRPSTDERWFELCGRALGGKPVRFEFQDNQTDRWYEVHMTRLSDSDFAQFYVDVTERKRNEARQTELFAELNHRVKNNLAVVSAILDIQARSTAPAVREQLAKAVDRIRSIADLHSTLYRQNSTDEVELRGYLQALGERLSQTLFEGGQVTVEVACDPVALSVGDSVSLGLIVNELVTNAAKHAFADGDGGVIHLTVTDSGSQLTLTVADGGKGLPVGAITRGPGLGFKLVRSLAQGLRGKVRVLEGPGASIEVVWPHVPASARENQQPRLL